MHTFFFKEILEIQQGWGGAGSACSCSSTSKRVDAHLETVFATRRIVIRRSFGLLPTGLLDSTARSPGYAPQELGTDYYVTCISWPSRVNGGHWPDTIAPRRVRLNQRRHIPAAVFVSVAKGELQPQ